MKARSCPNCNQQLKIEQIDYYFSDNLSLMCAICNKTVFPTTAQSEMDIDLTKRVKQVYLPNPQQHTYPYQPVHGVHNRIP